MTNSRPNLRPNRDIPDVAGDPPSVTDPRKLRNWGCTNKFADNPPSVTEPVANTPQPDLDQENVQFTIWAEDYMRRKGLTRLIGARDAWLAARRLSPDRKLVEAALRLAHEWAAKFPLGTEDSGADAHAANAVYKACAAALKTQEPAPEVIETCRCLLQRFIPHTGKLYRFVSSCDLCEEPAPKEKK